MKRSSPLAFLALTGLLLTACGGTTPGDVTAPTIKLTAAPKTVTAAGTVTLTADASDNVGVTKVTFYRGDKEIGTDTTAPFEIKDNVTADQNGSVVYRAVATDAAGNTADAADTVTINISTAPPADTTKPTVTLTAAPETVNAAGPVSLTADAKDNVGVVKVTFYRGDKEIGTDTTAPYEFKDNVTADQNGSVVYRAVAVDAAGNKGESTTTVTVNIDVTKPTVSLKAVPTIVMAAGEISLTADASDNVGVTKVTFYRGDKEIGIDTTAPYEFKDSVTAADNGTLNYRAVAADAAGNSAEATAMVKVDIDPNEPNDSTATATPLMVGKPINGSIAGQDRDMDYFKFDAAEGDKLMLTVKSTSIDSNSTLDPYVQILMPDGKTVVEKDDDGGADLESAIRFNVPQKGTYYVALTSFDIYDDAEATDNKITNTYQIALTNR
ncbi:hypothetical protein QR90_02430 [Deinococcus radiopugnans]|uniref:Peptidase C-terminal archaeal/bacterial domain-containing protein n=1 Tax=Deinococcus radiopugnans TaxID=57497 RepID=A0A0A7KI16_9DEIO|nr:Ig-like domain-containing protein [Deinococcus radiopugnans]AIZ44208.1 hypothetical protein QR90_02430 [Deinococcus radiopugnans]